MRTNVGIALTLRTTAQQRAALARNAKASLQLRNASGTRFHVTKKGVKVPKLGYLRAREGTSRLRQRLRASEQRARRRLPCLHARQRCVRRANLHRLTTDLATRCDVVGIEDLDVAGMLKNHGLARAIARQAWGELRKQMTYKSAWTGTKLVVVDRFFSSSRHCSRCHERKGTPSLDGRTTGVLPASSAWTETSTPPGTWPRSRNSIKMLLQRS